MLVLVLPPLQHYDDDYYYDYYDYYNYDCDYDDDYYYHYHHHHHHHYDDDDDYYYYYYYYYYYCYFDEVVSVSGRQDRSGHGGRW